jgi:hypothetical protein
MCNTDVVKALEGIISCLPEEQYILLCIGYWSFGIDEEMIYIWEFYEFIFHLVWNNERLEIFKLMAKRCGDVYQSLPIGEVISHCNAVFAK